MTETPDWANRYQPRRTPVLTENENAIFHDGVALTIAVISTLEEIRLAREKHQRVTDLQDRVAKYEDSIARAINFLDRLYPLHPLEGEGYESSPWTAEIQEAAHSLLEQFTE